MNTYKKNQHYIPKFYLKNFSYQGNNKQIGIFNLKSRFFFQRAKLKTQGSKNFFYGSDGKIEDSLSKIEGHLASIIKNIIQNRILPKKGELDHSKLLGFVGLTHLRNPVAIQAIKKSEAEMKKRILELYPETETDKLVPNVTQDEAIRLTLSNLERVINYMADLDYKLFINKTDIPFITSDFPVVKYNRFLEEKKWEHGKTGYGNIGLQIYIPLNSEIAIFFYDPVIYKVGYKKQSSFELINTKDVDQFNILQILNCIETVYFNENIVENYIRKIYTESKKFKKANQSFSSILKSIKPEDNKSNYITFGYTDCEIGLNISGIKKNSRAKKVKLSPTLAQFRKRPLELYRKGL